MKRLLRDGIRLLPAPWPVVVLDSLRYLRYGSVRRRRAFERGLIGRMESPPRIAQGPFQGMTYRSTAFCSSILPKLFGTYELELNPAIESIRTREADRIVDIGAAEGYYAVGLALRNPQARVVAFEMDPSARYYLRELARRNGVDDRVEIQGTCTLDALAQALEGAKAPVVVCDCEGAEVDLLVPDRVEALRRCFLIVEIHDGVPTDAGELEGIEDCLRERFSPTHEIEAVDDRPRVPSDLPVSFPLNAEDAARGMDEGRAFARWLVMTPRPAFDSGDPDRRPRA